MLFAYYQTHAIADKHSAQKFMVFSLLLLHDNRVISSLLCRIEVSNAKI